eukprot:8295790-Pyramimonas_sp.AAC.2
MTRLGTPNTSSRGPGLKETHVPSSGFEDYSRRNRRLASSAPDPSTLRYTVPDASTRGVSPSPRRGLSARTAREDNIPPILAFAE